MDLREKGRQAAKNLTATVSILSLGVTGVASLFLWGATSATSASSSSSSSSTTTSTDSTNSSDDDSGSTSIVGQSTGGSSHASSTGS